MRICSSRCRSRSWRSWRRRGHGRSALRGWRATYRDRRARNERRASKRARGALVGYLVLTPRCLPRRRNRWPVAAVMGARVIALDDNAGVRELLADLASEIEAGKVRAVAFICSEAGGRMAPWWGA